MPPVRVNASHKYREQWRDCCDCIHDKEYSSNRCRICFDDPARPGWVAKWAVAGNVVQVEQRPKQRKDSTVKKVIIGIVIGILMALGVIMAFGDEPAVTLDIPVSSDYVWRGQVFDDEAVIQPSLGVEFHGFGLEYWQNYSTKDDVINEYNVTLGYTHGLGPVALTLGLVSYDYPNTEDPSTQEVFLSLAMDGLVSPFLTAYYDVNETEALYIELGASYTYDLTDKTSIELAVSVGAGDEAYSEYWFGMPDARMQDGNIRVSIPWAMTEKLTLTLSGQFTAMLDPDIDEDYTDPECWIGTLGLAYTL